MSGDFIGIEQHHARDFEHLAVLVHRLGHGPHDSRHLVVEQHVPHRDRHNQPPHAVRPCQRHHRQRRRRELPVILTSYCSLHDLVHIQQRLSDFRQARELKLILEVGDLCGVEQPDLAAAARRQLLPLFHLLYGPLRYDSRLQQLVLQVLSH